MSASAKRAPEGETETEKQMSLRKKESEPPRRRALGTLFACEDNGSSTLKVLYIPSVSIEERDRIAERCGIGSLEWKAR